MLMKVFCAASMARVVVEKELVREIVDALIPELHQLALGILIALAGPGNQGIRVHHSYLK
jgi:hypothetical protein